MKKKWWQKAGLWVILSSFGSSTPVFAANEWWYTVRAGDTVSQISERELGSAYDFMNDIRALNPGVAARHPQLWWIRIGENLLLPEGHIRRQQRERREAEARAAEERRQAEARRQAEIRRQQEEQQRKETEEARLQEEKRKQAQLLSQQEEAKQTQLALLQKQATALCQAIETQACQNQTLAEEVQRKEEDNSLFGQLHSLLTAQLSELEAEHQRLARHLADQQEKTWVATQEAELLAYRLALQAQHESN